MGSLRNPVGPLPASIYWRRRIVLLSAVALLALLITWLLSLGGGDRKDNSGRSDSKHPAPSTITPGPSGSGPAISERPGGRDESDEGAGGPGPGAGVPGGTDGSGSDSGGGPAGGDGEDAGAGSGGEGGAAGSGGGTGPALPAGSTLPNCAPSAVKLTLRSVRNSYEPEEKPAFELVARNTSDSDCKIDLGPRTAVVTISQADSDDTYWSSADCPKTAGSRLYRVPAGSSITYTITWDRKPSAARCATPPAGSARAGTYLVEAKVPGHDRLRTSFVLEAA
ncbi:hypothetical protein STXM2123_2387 [Streptomyces sp. F-3]|uniref:Uncharacterized protein n=1 Tax=Streptomyces thermogriseus TaxID=75292 RepID=A0ABN1T4U4_9ACTN|nr:MULTISPECIES: hypothetical protein [Streptomyces]MDN5381198.1 hypothetical protein [Streptomyces sp. LB8]GAT81686.1 hypothetical protein STXM2123_2387 [Streptomyces sp. F-3]